MQSGHVLFMITQLVGGKTKIRIYSISHGQLAPRIRANADNVNSGDLGTIIIANTP